MSKKNDHKVNNVNNMGYFMLKEQNKKNDLPVLSIMHTPHKRDEEHEE